MSRILLVKPPYFTPWTPPLGIAILKAFLEQHEYSVRCFDFNTDPDLWGMHHKYFRDIQTLEGVTINDGYSKLWWILNAHMLAYANGADADACAKVLETIIPMYGIRKDNNTIQALLRHVNTFFKRYEECIENLDLSDYSVVGTSTYSTSLGSSLFLLKKLKKKYPHLTTVMGGGIFADDLALGSDNLEVLIENYSFIDHVVVGEGELLFLKLLQGEMAHKRVISIADLNGSTLQMRDVPTPDFSDLNLENYYHLTIEGARSCPFQCSFCSETIQWGNYRKKPIDLFVQQVVELTDRNKNNSFFLGDSLMNPYVAHFSEELLKRQANILYDGYLRADKPVTHRDRVKNWAKSGLYRVRLGIESASARVLDSMDKMTSPATIADVLKTLANAGIRTTTYWIVGFPGETEEDFLETLDFIRSNYRYIYELEAHPYYYYPYGQIGSRLYQSRSLYPDNVTETIKFKVWDIIDCNPTREERYRRLRIISELASSLGLPNIYTMADRYRAEERWMSLYPLAIEVYAGSSLHRDQVAPPNHAVEIYAGEWENSDAVTHSLSSPLCYRITVRKKLDESLLAASVEHLIRNQEMLQMSLRDGKYVPMPAGADWRNSNMVSAHQADSDQEFETWLSQIVERPPVQILPECGSMLHIALINREASCDLLLMAHRAMVDGQGLVLLCEDLFRIYEQLSHGKPLALRPVKKTYTAFMTEHSLASHQSVSNPRMAQGNRQSKVEVKSLVFGDGLSGRMRADILSQNGVMPAAIILSAISRCFERTKGEQIVSVDIRCDARSAYPGLDRMVGALTRDHSLRRLPFTELNDARGAQRVLERLPLIDGGNVKSDALETLETDALRVRWNLEYCVNEPWLGGDQWSARGFVVSEERLPENYLIEVTPYWSPDEFKAVIKYYDAPAITDFVERFVTSLPEEVRVLLDDCEKYVAAKTYWLSEFGKGIPGQNIERETSDIPNSEPTLIDFTIEDGLASRLQSEYGAELSDLVLAGYGILVSLLNGRDETLIVASFSELNGGNLVPLRLYLSEDVTFAGFIRQVENKRAWATDHEAFADEVLTGRLFDAQTGRSDVMFDVGYIFTETGAKPVTVSDVERTLRQYQPNNQSLALVLKAIKTVDGLTLQMAVQSDLFGQCKSETLASYLQSILEQAAANTCLRLAEISLGQKSESLIAADVLADEMFQF